MILLQQKQTCKFEIVTVFLNVQVFKNNLYQTFFEPNGFQ